ncbi:hypothetical protein V1291_003986 [Nitrobacteraceae bacterium AZCC 1564]
MVEMRFLTDPSALLFAESRTGIGRSFEISRHHLPSRRIVFEPTLIYIVPC